MDLLWVKTLILLSDKLNLIKITMLMPIAIRMDHPTKILIKIPLNQVINIRKIIKILNL